MLLSTTLGGVREFSDVPEEHHDDPMAPSESTPDLPNLDPLIPLVERRQSPWNDVSKVERPDTTRPSERQQHRNDVPKRAEPTEPGVPDVPDPADVQEPPVVLGGSDLSEPHGLPAHEALRLGKLRSIRDHLAEIFEDFGRRAGRISRPVVITSLAVAVGAPVVAAAFSTIGPAAAAFLNQVGAFGAGYLTEKVASWLQQDSKAKSTNADEDTVRQVLTRMMQDTAAESSVAPQHLAALLADPVLLGAILTVARTKGSELLRFRPKSHADDDDWLYEEVVEALEELALTPTFLESALRQAFRELAVDRNS